MKAWSLILPNLRRNPTRTSLTFFSLVVAFTLFMLLRAIASAFSGGISLEGASRLIVDAKYSMIENLPLTYVQQIRDLDGVAQVTHMSWFGGFYQDQSNTFATYPVDPASYFDSYREYVVEPAVVERFSNNRVGAVVSQSLAEEYGWSVGDVIPIQGDIWPKEDGSWDWTFELVGTFRPKDGQPAPRLFLLRYDYFNEAVADWAKHQVGWLVVRVEKAERAERVARAIDARFEHSADPTRTASEDDYYRQFARQLGDIGAISTMILGSVFFSIVLLTGNVTSQALRERIPELATLKTLGFSDGAVSTLVLAEPVLLCLAGASAGIALALVMQPALHAGLVGVIGSFEMSRESVLVGAGLALVIGLGIGAQPAWAARRLTIVDGLRER